MAMVTAIWAAAAEVIITDGAGDAVITTAGTAVDITIATETLRGPRCGGLLLHLCAVSTILSSDPH